MINVKDDKQVERYVPILKSEINRLLALLQDFLLINKSNLDLDIMDMNMLVEETIDKLKPLLNDNNITIESIPRTISSVSINLAVFSCSRFRLTRLFSASAAAVFRLFRKLRGRGVGRASVREICAPRAEVRHRTPGRSRQ